MGVVKWTFIKFVCGVIICFDFSRVECFDRGNGAIANNNGDIPVGDPCNFQKNDCVANATCQKQDNVNLLGICECKNGFFTKDGSCELKIPLDQECFENGSVDQCSAANSRCNKRCVCNDRFYKLNNTCLEKISLNERCVRGGPPDQCMDENSECSHENLCKCKRSFFHSVGNGCSLICGSLDIRNVVSEFDKLDNCTIIEGSLQILLIDKENEDYQGLHYPMLREIKDYLLLYRVYGLKTLRHIFPNLQVIRGINTFIDYSLVAFEMTDLEEFGLVSLTSIQKGGIWVEKNPNLCYLNTIDWSKIAPGRRPFIKENKMDCVDICPQNCEGTYDSTFRLANVPRCWTKFDCQKNLDCVSECSGDGQFCSSGGQCCHDLCVGGCTGRGHIDCTACKHITQGGECRNECSASTYKFEEIRCLSARECASLSGHYLLEQYDPITQRILKSCVSDCPAKYSLHEDKKRCVKCSDKLCPKVCEGTSVDSLSAAKSLAGCTEITTSLNIQLTSGNMDLLEKYLGHIEVIRSDLKVFKSSALVSLAFFKNLRLIEGKNPKKGKALYVADNPNLKSLFTKEVTERLQIKHGNVTFLYNRKLCQSKIKELLWNLNKSIANTSEDIVLDPNNLNGDQIPCSIVKLDLTIKRISPNFVYFKYSVHDVVDARDLISYHMYYRAVGEKNVSRYDGRDACSEKVWKVKQSEPIQENGENFDFIGPLTPWTRYAIFVEAFMLSNAKEGAMTDIVYFTTEPEQPSLVQNVIIKADTGNSLDVSWDPPKFPNGNVTHYYIFWRDTHKNVTEYNLRDYCKQPLQDRYSLKGQGSDKVEKLNISRSPNCCACPKTEKQLVQEQKDRKMAVAFENFLQNTVYNKRPRETEDNLTHNPIDRALGVLPFGNKEDELLRNMTAWMVNERVNEWKNQNNKTEFEKPFYEFNGRPKQNTQFLPTDKKNATNVNETTNIKDWAIVYDTQLTLTNLKHFTEYNIEILACQERYGSIQDKKCSKKAIATARSLKNDTADNIPNYNITAVELKNKTGGEVLIKWLPPPHPNGLVIRYLIVYKKVGSTENISVCVSTKEYKMYSGGFKLTKLSSGNFTFRIQAESLADTGAWTPVHYFYVHDRTEADFEKEKIIIITVVSLVVVITLTVVVVFFVTKHRFGKIIQDLHISINPDYQEYDPDEWEVERDKVKLIKELGQGSFGMVYEGIARDLDEHNKELRVAVKTVNERATQSERISFLKEASTMKAFNTYHVVKLIGVVSQGSPPYVIMELMAKGDLKSYLRAHRPEENPEVEAISLKKILYMAGEIADGMAYLADKKFVHRDLAARNCMVAEDLSVKIGDFGMTRDIYETDYYKKGSKGLLPVRWMSPESLKDGLYTSLSDVWSFGVVFWEMATLAAQPYQGLSNEEVFKYVSYGNIMDKPEGCPDKMFDLMQKCWQYKPSERPTFKDVIEILIPDLDEKFQKVSYYFSDDNKQHYGDDSYDCLDDTYDAFADNQDESQIPLTQGVSTEKIELGDMSMVRVERSDSEVSEDSLIPQNHNCQKLNYQSESELNSAIDSNEGSKESSTSKSSNSSYAQMNGFANGFVGSRYPRTTKC